MSKLRYMVDAAVYRLVLLFILPLIPLRLLWRGLRERAYWAHWRERFAMASVPRGALWIHAVSVGETRAAAPLIAALRMRYPDSPVLLTCMTATGRATAEVLYGEFAQVRYLPYDYAVLMRRFMAQARPHVCVLMETELWPNLIAEARRIQLPLVLANARLSARSAARYAWLPALTHTSLAAFDVIAAQTDADAARLTRLGARQVSVTGSLKFDVTAPRAQALAGQTWRSLWGASRPVLLAASTRAGEEALIVAAWHARAPADALLVLVPRHPQRFEEVAAHLHASGMKWIRRSQLHPGVPLAADIRVLLGDSLGELFAYYAAADLAFVGGSLLPFGGQNLIEACQAGCPVLIGVHTYNFEEAARQAIAAGAAQRVEDAEDLVATALTLLKDQPARAAMQAAGLRFAGYYRGATARVMALIAPLLDSDRPRPDPPRSTRPRQPLD